MNDRISTSSTVWADTLRFKLSAYESKLFCGNFDRTEQYLLRSK